MRRWAWLVVALYMAALLLLSWPVLWLASFGLEFDPELGRDRWQSWVDPFGDDNEWWGTWFFWAWIGLLVASQATLLLVRVPPPRARLRPRRSLNWPIWVSAWLMGNLALAGLLCVLSLAMADEVFVFFYRPAEFLADAIQARPALAAALAPWDLDNEDTLSALHFLGALLIFWMVWFLIFKHYSRADLPQNRMRRALRWLLRGSVLELLVAVPSHVVVRAREDCCAPVFTFWGMATGLSVMLLCFGPGVLYLFLKRCRERRPRTSPPSAGPPLTLPGTDDNLQA